MHGVHSNLCYSVLRIFAGLEIAAFTACTLTVIIAINTTITPAAPNVHQLIFMR